MKSAQDWINDLQLQEHPEGGYFAETYRSPIAVESSDGRRRPAGTVIYYLIEGGTRSYLHRLKSEEVWYFHEGCPLELVIINNDHEVRVHKLGLDPGMGEHPHFVIPSGTWFGAVPQNLELYTLVSCSVSPGFEFEDFELADRGELTARFPEHRELIERFTRAE